MTFWTIAALGFLAIVGEVLFILAFGASLMNTPPNDWYRIHYESIGIFSIAIITLSVSGYLTILSALDI